MATSPLLSVVTRTFLGRPVGLARCKASVNRQTRLDLVQHILLIDEQRRGIEWTYDHMDRVLPMLAGRYVLLLDDDDYLIDDDLTNQLVGLADQRPAVIMVKMDMGDGRVLPGSTWGSRPELGDVPCSAFIVRRDVFERHIHDFGADYGGDANFIKKVWDAGHTFVWLDRVASKIGRVSRGQPEDGRPAAERVSA